jgi:high-affinity K+ transport system ATPase subunit B
MDRLHFATEDVRDGGLIVPFIGIKLIDLLIGAAGLV